MKLRFLLACVALALVAASVPQSVSAGDDLTLVVMDPLSAPLSCDCVKGYAQRKYELLGEFLSEQLDCHVNVVWNESLGQAVKETAGHADIVIGKYSVVLYDAERLQRKMLPVASLTGKTGQITQRGLIVVRSGDRAKTVSDLAGYRMFFGPEEAAEKSAAPMKLLKDNGVTIPEKPERYGACSEAAVALMELPADVDACAIISSYAEPLLEGCGSIQKGDLRVIGKTDEIPFVTAFVPETMDPATRKKIEQALAEVGTNPELLIGLETEIGFVPWEEDKTTDKVASKKN